MREERTYPVLISSGLLTREHYKKIGIAYWEFTWLLYRVTKVDANGRGIVLGGKPVRLQQIADELGKTKQNVFKCLKRLKKNGYIETLRTPYGNTIFVKKCKKRIVDFDDSASSKMTIPIVENDYSKEDIVVDNVVKILPPSAEKTMLLEPDTPDKILDADTLEEISSLKEEQKRQLGYDSKDTNALLAWGSEKLGHRFTQPLKQKRHIVSMLISGWKPNEIKEKWEDLEDDKFWAGRGIDFSIVASQIDKARVEKKSNPLIYAKRR